MLYLPQTRVWRRLLYTRGRRDDRLYTRGRGDDRLYTHGCRDDRLYTRGRNNSCLAELHFWISKEGIEAHSGNRGGARNPAAKSSCLFRFSSSSFTSPHDNLLLQLSASLGSSLGEAGRLFR